MFTETKLHVGQLNETFAAEQTDITGNSLMQCLWRQKRTLFCMQETVFSTGALNRVQQHFTKICIQHFANFTALAYLCLAMS